MVLHHNAAGSESTVRSAPVRTGRACFPALWGTDLGPRGRNTYEQLHVHCSLHL